MVFSVENKHTCGCTCHTDENFYKAARKNRFSKLQENKKRIGFCKEESRSTDFTQIHKEEMHTECASETHTWKKNRMERKCSQNESVFAKRKTGARILHKFIGKKGTQRCASETRTWKKNRMERKCSQKGERKKQSTSKSARTTSRERNRTHPTVQEQQVEERRIQNCWKRERGREREGSRTCFGGDRAGRGGSKC
jgi:hypothetical protein